jgi:hypothetical protein
MHLHTPATYLEIAPPRADVADDAEHRTHDCTCHSITTLFPALNVGQW